MKSKIPWQEYFYEDPYLVHFGFGEKWYEKLDGMAVKVFSYGLKNIPVDADVSIIYMQRNFDEVVSSLLAYKPPRNLLTDMMASHMSYKQAKERFGSKISALDYETVIKEDFSL